MAIDEHGQIIRRTNRQKIMMKLLKKIQSVNWICFFFYNKEVRTIAL